MTPEELAKKLGGTILEESKVLSADDLAVRLGGTISKTEATPEGENLPTVIPVVDSIVRAAAHPILKATATVSQGGAALLARMISGKAAGSKAIDVARKGIDYGYFGTVKPIGADAQEDLIKGDIEYEDAARKSVMDLAGTTLEVSSYFFAPLKLAKGGIISAPLRYAKAIAPFAAPFATGIGLQEAAKGDVAPEDELGAGAVAAGKAFAGALTGYGLLNGGGMALAWAGGLFMKSKVGTALAERLSSYATRLGDYVNAVQRKSLGDELAVEYAAFQNKVDDTQNRLLKNALNEYYATSYIDEPILLETIKGNYSKVSRQYYDERDNLFSVALDAVAETLRVDKAPVDEANLAIRNWFKSNVEAQRGAALAEALGNRDYLNLNDVLALPTENLTPRQAYDIFRSLPNYRSENPVIDKLIRDKMFAYLEGIRGVFTREAPERMDAFNRAFNYADQVRLNVDDPLVHRIRTAGSAANLVDGIMNGITPTSEQTRVFMESFTSAQERQNYSQIIFNAILNKARNQDTLGDTSRVLEDTLKWVKHSRTTSGDTILTPDHLATLEQLGRLSQSDFNTFLRQAQIVGKGGEMTPDVELAIQQITDLNRVKAIADRTNNFREYSILGEEIGNIRSVETLQAFLNLIPERNQEMKNTLGREVIRGAFQRNTKNIVTDTGELNTTAVEQMVSGFLNDVDRIGGSNKKEIFASLFEGVSVKVGDEAIPMANYLLELDASLLAVQQSLMPSAAKMVQYTHLLTGGLYAMTGRNVPAIYHISQFFRAKGNYQTYAKVYDDVVEQLRSENKIRERALTEFGKEMQRIAQETQYPGLIGGFSEQAIASGAEEMLGRPLTLEEKEDIARQFREGK